MPDCYFCKKPITKLFGRDADSLGIHHIDGNHDNDTPENRASVHYGCHSTYHMKGNQYGKALKGLCLLEDHKRKISLAMMGHSVSEKTKDAVKKAHLGNQYWKLRKDLRRG